MADRSSPVPAQAPGQDSHEDKIPEQFRAKMEQIRRKSMISRGGGSPGNSSSSSTPSSGGGGDSGGADPVADPGVGEQTEWVEVTLGSMGLDASNGEEYQDEGDYMPNGEFDEQAEYNNGEFDQRHIQDHHHRQGEYHHQQHQPQNNQKQQQRAFSGSSPSTSTSMSTIMNTSMNTNTRRQSVARQHLRTMSAAHKQLHDMAGGGESHGGGGGSGDSGSGGSGSRDCGSRSARLGPGGLGRVGVPVNRRGSLVKTLMLQVSERGSQAVRA